MNYRFARPDEIPAVARLVAHSFPAANRAPGWFQEHLATPVFGGGPETLLIGGDERGIAAACQIHPLRQWVAGEPLHVSGVGTVAISPTHRKQRLGAALVRAALHAGRERGDVAACLYPFRVSFYRALGFGLAGEAVQVQVASRALPDSAERHRVELLESETARASALRLYEHWMREQTGQLERTPGMWTRLFDEEDHALVGYRAPDGALEGYALGLYRTDLEPGERFLEIDEMVWLTDSARRGLYGWLASLDDQWQQIVLRTLPSHRIGDWLREPRLPRGRAPSWRLWAPAATLLSGPMFRLLDVRGAFEGRRIEQAPALALTLELSDADIEANVGSWRIALDAGRATVERSGGVDLTLRMDVSTLSRIYIGALPPSAALAAGLLECDRPELVPVLDAALALPEPWTFDRF
ncbi:MAG TPA: GNAT family N-acetyltransferase [Longimicrobiales bacterium]